MKIGDIAWEIMPLIDFGESDSVAGYEVRGHFHGMSLARFIPAEGLGAAYGDQIERTMRVITQEIAWQHSRTRGSL